MFKLENREELVAIFGEEEIEKMEQEMEKALEETRKSLGSHYAFKSEEDREAFFDDLSKSIAEAVVETAKAKNPKKDEKYPPPDKKPKKDDEDEEEEKAQPAALALGKIAKLVAKDDSPLAKKIISVLKAAGVDIGKEGYGYPPPKEKSLEEFEREFEFYDRLSAVEEQLAPLPSILKALADRKSQEASDLVKALQPLLQEEGETKYPKLSKDELEQFKAFQAQQEQAAKAHGDRFRDFFGSKLGD